MGLFTRNAEMKEQIESMRAELRTMRRRLDETEQDKQRLADQLDQVQTEHRRISNDVDGVTTKMATVESTVGTVETTVGRVESTVGVVENKVGDVDSMRTELIRLDELARRIDELSSSPESGEPSLPPPSATPNRESLAVLQQQLDELAEAVNRQREHIADIAVVATDSAERTDTALAEIRAFLDADGGERHTSDDSELRSQLGLLAEKVGAVDSRVNQISLELTNQLTELSDDLERAGERADVGADGDGNLDELIARLDEITGGQERLASEQARYAIQFRNDLAGLAERLRRPGAR